jgi:inward rectifier potassium channel
MARITDPYDIEIVNAPPPRAFDLYHQLLKAPWWVDLVLIASTFVVSNLLFALAFWAVGGVANAQSFREYFFFSVQTMGTIGYGAMYPVGLWANVLVVIEAVFGLIMVAVFTGLVFAKFSVPKARVRFASRLAVSPVEGVPTLQLRCGNERANQLVEARVRLALVRTERTKEGTQMYRMYDLSLVRDTTPLFARSWNVMHRLVEGSPLHQATPESLEEWEAEIVVTLTGLDEHSSQLVHARYRYLASDVVFGARHADMLTDVSPTQMRLDLAKFDELLPTSRTDAFRYP